MKFLTYRTFHDAQSASTLIDILKDNGVDFITEDHSPSMDGTFIGVDPLAREILIKINPDDFNEVNKLLEKDALIDIESDHYLHQFSDEELYEILLKPDEWTPIDYSLAKNMLQARGKGIDEDLINSLRSQRLQDLSKQAESQTPWIILAYFSTLLGGFLGILIGLHLMTSNKVLPNGEKVNRYQEQDRKNGKIIFIIGLILTPIYIYIRFADQF